jgi:hypothetical protein
MEQRNKRRSNKACSSRTKEKEERIERLKNRRTNVDPTCPKYSGRFDDDVEMWIFSVTHSMAMQKVLVKNSGRNKWKEVKVVDELYSLRQGNNYDAFEQTSTPSENNL